MILSLDRNHRILIGIIVLAIVIAIALIWLSRSWDSTDDADELEKSKSPMSVAVGRGRVDIDGNLIQITVQRDDVVVEVFVEEGVDVKAGQLLARLDDSVPRAALNQTRASLAGSKASLDVLAARLKAAQSERDRYAVLTRGGAESIKSLNDAQRRIEETLADMARQYSAMALAVARLQPAEVELMLREIHAPGDGRIVWRQARPGIGTSTLNVSTLFTLVSVEQYVVWVDLEESFLYKVEVGKRVQVTLEASAQAIEAKVLRIGEIFGQHKINPTDTQTRMDEHQAEVMVPLPPSSYRIGQRALVKFLPLEVSDPSAVLRPPGVRHTAVPLTAPTWVQENAP